MARRPPVKLLLNVPDPSAWLTQNACPFQSFDDINSSPCGPLHGVPITIKINVDQKGYATSNGVSALKDWIAPDDAPIVTNLQNAGAIIIGRTNTPEFSFRADTDNGLNS